jgi:hypothetical protein
MRIGRTEISFKAWLTILFFLVIALYSAFQARFLILGPHVEIESPKNGETLPAGLVTVLGRAENISFISLNDRPIFVDESGNWNEKLIAPEGLSIMTVKARDRFGRTTEERIEIFVN